MSYKNIRIQSHFGHLRHLWLMVNANKIGMDESFVQNQMVEGIHHFKNIYARIFDPEAKFAILPSIKLFCGFNIPQIWKDGVGGRPKSCPGGPSIVQ